MRDWEIWDTEIAERLAGFWRHPSTFNKGKYDTHLLLVKKTSELIEGKSVLDIGCGLGHLYYFAHRRYDYLGIDTSEAMLLQAKKWFPEGSFVYGDSLDLSELQMFDSVVSNMVIRHLPESEKPIREAWSKARKCMIIVTMIGDVYKEIRGSDGEIDRTETTARLLEIANALPGIGEITTYYLRGEPGFNTSDFMIRCRRKSDA